jgi:GNAT superfamily N-acetyltransferase
MENSGIQVIEYQPYHQPWFEKLNRAWIEKYFWMEPIDIEVLQNPEEHILRHGGRILMATYDGEVAGTVALKFVKEGVYEFTKMAVDEKYQGLKIGLRLAEVAIEKAQSLGASSIILYSSTKLPTALSLYRKIGFAEIPLDGPYKRSDIKMELVLTGDLHIRHASLADRDVLIALGIQTFSETFEHLNSAENMKAYLEKSFTPQQLESELKEAGSIFLLAYDGTQAVGYARMRTSNNHENRHETHTIEIERIYVLQSHLGKRAGQRLMETCIAYAHTKKYNSVWLGVWEHNARAIRFYEKWGFTPFSSHVFMLGQDAQTDILMKKML